MNRHLANEQYLMADWPAPASVQAFTTLRSGGVSSGAYARFNLGLRSGDALASVTTNRQRLMDDWGWSHPPQWLEQVHGAEVVTAQPDGQERQGDAVVSTEVEQPCVVLTADCLPVLFCHTAGTVVAAAHAGWKGLAAGVLENTVKAMRCSPAQIMAWLGPAISQPCFELGPEVREAFVQKNPKMADAFVAGKADRWHGDLYQLARLALNTAGVTQVYGGGFCTVTDDQRFFSYRRDGQASGRMAAVISLRKSTDQ
ncbi:peptidoglycan editing factor PgeF [Candidatus Sororendozoicomonas aggregata]|uniref:peptidoglycan editing factor PgeF n=1 Tax=Candidatus Sororendozoicomonas aggregata TaxID=3073239 RepID=UPI002ED3D5AB